MWREWTTDTFSSIQNEYDPLQSEDIKIPEFKESEIPQFNTAQVWFALSWIETNKSTVPGDFSAVLIKQFAAYLTDPFTDILNTILRRGEYPKLYKFELCTPVPKCYPPTAVSQLRYISGVLNFDKIMEKLIAKLIISDMETSMDPA